MSIILEQLTKRYERYPVVNNVSLEIADGEFFVLLGSSGSGKTTILNLIAGLTSLDHGRVLLHGRDVTQLPTQKRQVGFVFQNYALFQYMTVSENIEFGLSVRKVVKAERRQQSEELLDLVGLSGLGNRMPRQLSGGQQQRVALARALASRPDVLLLDEPLGALDAKIRVELRRSLKAIQRRLGIATILVTHDQEEAFDLADRIGVMSFGRLLEVGTPEELYQRPQTEFVATFLGTANLLVGRASGGKVHVGPVAFMENDNIVENREGDRLQVLFRPEDVSLAPEVDGLDSPLLGMAEVEETSYAGSFERLRLRLPPIPGVRPIAPPVAFGNDSILIDATRPPDQAARFPLQPGDKACVGVRRIHSLAHPGLSFLIVTDGSLRSQAAIQLGGHIARLAHARVTLLGCGRRVQELETHMQEARKALGIGPSSLQLRITPEAPATAIARVVERQPHDLVVMGFNFDEDHELAEDILLAGEHHLLLVPSPQTAAPGQALICVSTGEPGKDDVLFAGRLVRHLGAEATLLTVIPPAAGEALHKRAERFLASGVKSLNILGVPAKPLVRSGLVSPQVLEELQQGSYDFLVVGSPLAGQSGRISLDGVAGQVLRRVTDRAILIVRSRYMGAKVYPVSEQDQTHMIEEILR